MKVPFAAKVCVSLAGVISAVIFAPAALANSYNAYNWAGYVADHGTYSSVSGSWVVPAMGSSSDYSANGQWIGIGGFSHSDLIQAGTRAVAHDGIVTYTAWYELIPAPAVVLPFTISAGDAISASIAEVSPDAWSITLVDATTGDSFQTEVSYQSSQSSAEWIEEMPRGESGYLSLGSFDTITFSNMNATKNGASTPLSRLSAHALTMITSEGATVAAPSLPQISANSFIVKQF